jgi:ESF2/ABP1 family protein
LVGLQNAYWVGLKLTDLLAAHEAAVHRAKLRVELSQSKAEQQQYLKNVELAHVLDKRAAKKREQGEGLQLRQNPQKMVRDSNVRKKQKSSLPPVTERTALSGMLSSIF